MLCKTLPNQPYVKSPAPRLTTVTSPKSAPCQAVNKVQAAWLITLTPTRVSYPAARELVLMIIGTHTPWLPAQPPPLQPTALFRALDSPRRSPRASGVQIGSPCPLHMSVRSFSKCVISEALSSLQTTRLLSLVPLLGTGSKFSTAGKKRLGWMCSL